MAIKFVLVTGATGFIGAHIVDALLSRGLRVRGATRSMAKGEAMMKARPQYKEQLEFVQINDFESPGGLVDAVKGVDGIIHTASVSPNPPYYQAGRALARLGWCERGLGGLSGCGQGRCSR